ncbi:MAG: hypothetical protein GF329_07530 [Candidatus Lokiarchaeota archaeon]|nr:hypothetical protein [Candidatus Lokiarchaeota archaeon]
MVVEYYMIRGIGAFFYTLEFLIAMGVFLLVFYLYLRRINRKMIFVFLIGGLINTGVELLLQGLGIRIIAEAYFFTLPIDFPYICFILGFYEGGVKTVIGYCMVIYLLYRKRLFKRLLLFLVLSIFITFFVYSASTAYYLIIEPESVLFTARNMTGILPNLLLLIAFGVSLLSFLLNKKITKKRKYTIFFYMLGQIAYLLAFTIPLHIFMLRYIGFDSGSTYTPANIFAQIIFMYGYFLLFEGIGVNIIAYPIIYQLKLVEF